MQDELVMETPTPALLAVLVDNKTSVSGFIGVYKGLYGFIRVYKDL